MFISQVVVNDNHYDEYVLNAGARNQSSGDRRYGQHQLLWQLFKNDTERKFLFRDMGKGFIIYSENKPEGDDRFRSIKTREFTPKLKIGDKLRFDLSVNATNSVRTENGKTRHNDVVMDGLCKLPEHERHTKFQQMVSQAGTHWLEKVSKHGGFALQQCHVKDYFREHVLKRRKSAHQNYGILDIEGVLEITDPQKFTEKLLTGYGRAKAFGCGLMLIRRAV